MTGHRQPWYLDRLRDELERVAAIEGRRERGPAPGRPRPAPAGRARRRRRWWRSPWSLPSSRSS